MRLATNVFLLSSRRDYTLVILKYVVNLLNAPVSSVLRHYDFDCDWECVNAFSHCGTLTRVLLLQIISCSDTKVLILSCYGIQAYKYVLLCTVYELIYLLHTSRSTEYRSICFIYKWE